MKRTPHGLALAWAASMLFWSAAASGQIFPIDCDTVNAENVTAGSTITNGYTAGFVSSNGYWSLGNNTSFQIPDNGIICVRRITGSGNVRTINLLRNSNNTPVTIYVEEYVSMSNSRLVVSGGSSATYNSLGMTYRGGIGGPGGSDGGSCENNPITGLRAGEGLGPGGGKGSVVGGGGGGASATRPGQGGHNGGAGGLHTSSFEERILHGGSGGGCGFRSSTLFGGGGGGGVMTIAATQYIDTGATSGGFYALGGSANQGGGGGGGGVVRLVSPTIQGSGNLDVRGNAGGTCGSSSNPTGGCGANGLVKLEGTTVNGNFVLTAFNLNGKDSVKFGTPQQIAPATALVPTVRIINIAADFDGIATDQMPPPVDFLLHTYQRRAVYFESNQVLTLTLETTHVPPTALVNVRMNTIETNPAASVNTVVQATSPTGAGITKNWTATLTVPAGTKIGSLEAWVNSVCTPGTTGCPVVE